ncbi:polysaccharide deacetylase family protein [Pusillimonas sp. TS35]|uniref:polysaccharide deacetylase family protein n=1 Tax=Paracandidimonas lactea TaxID=2895524 RepID=UPI0013682049|nr:polysaccharide deacetylase family protein [Paracandidimonas lactea]MYN13848.1 polysaccharide deacetylase family protein [Pusillimonas sp. TS35]
MNRFRTVPVLMYHHVSPTPGMLNVSLEHFEDQLRWLSRHGYRSLSSAEFARHLAGEAAPRKAVLITFDDGYLDNWVYAYPLLKQYGFSAMLFLVTAWAGDGPLRPHLGQASLPETPDHRDCEARIAEGRADEVIVRWSEAQAMQDDGVFEIHSHTDTHTRWDKTDPAHKNTHMARELQHARDTLRGRLGSVSDHHCWPQGYYDAEYIDLAHAVGFRHLYTTMAFGSNRPGSDPAHISRFAVRNTTGRSVGRRIWVAAHPLIGPIFNRFKLLKRKLRRKP